MAADRLQTGVQAGLVKIGLRTQHNRVGNRAKTGVRAEQWWPDEAASSGVVGQVAAARRETASGRRGITSGRCGITSGRRETAAAGSSDAARNIVKEDTRYRQRNIVWATRRGIATRCSGISSRPRAAR